MMFVVHIQMLILQMWIKILPPEFKAQLWYALLDRFVHLHGKVELNMTCMLTSGSAMRSSVIK